MEDNLLVDESLQRQEGQRDGMELHMGKRFFCR